MTDMSSAYSQKLMGFWHQTLKRLGNNKMSMKNLNLPLARIKRLMKVEEDVRMVASEVPVMFSLVTDVFISELTTRAWINTQESKRRIMQKMDIVGGINSTPMYDFLISIIPQQSGYQGGRGAEDGGHSVFLEPLHKSMNFNTFN